MITHINVRNSKNINKYTKHNNLVFLFITKINYKFYQSKVIFIFIPEMEAHVIVYHWNKRPNSRGAGEKKIGFINVGFRFSSINFLSARKKLSLKGDVVQTFWNLFSFCWTYRHGMCFRVSFVFVLSILFWFPQRTHYFWVQDVSAIVPILP